METNEIKRGRLIDHLHLVVHDIAATKRFYEAVLATLDIKISHAGEDWFSADELFVSTAESKSGHMKLTGYTHLAFQAKSEALVQAFHAAGLRAGGKDNGAPGPRKQYHPGYYASFLLDPDGNNVEAVFHGPAEYSAQAITVTFSPPER